MPLMQAVCAAPKQREPAIDFQNFRKRVLTIYKNHPVGNFRHKHKTIKCEVSGVGITIKHIHIS